MKFYVLTSRSIEGLQRNTKTLPKEDMVVVINTLDDDYRSLAKDHCETNDIEYYITQSDGTPATGKNSVIKLFLESDQDYMVQIDGDDFLTPLGIKLYKQLSAIENPPDMVVLYRQPQIKKILDFDSMFSSWDGDLRSLSKHWGVRYPMDKSDPDFERQIPSSLYKYFIEFCGVDDTTAKRWSIDRYDFNTSMNMFSEVREYMSRMVFYSRKVAEHVNFGNEIIIGEDTIQFLKLKKLAIEGKLNIVRRKERHYPTYIYTDTEEQITRKDFQSGINWDWIRPFLNELDKIRHDLPVNVSLPEFKDPI